MSTVHETITVAAPIDRVFALSTNVALVQRTLGMKLVEGPASVTAGSRVHWRGWKFGLPTHHHTLITGFTPPQSSGDTLAAFFQDSQESGRFATFHHDHFFTQTSPNTTTLEDRVHFTLPLWLGGALAERYLLGPYIRRLARERFALIKRLAESEEWRQHLSS